MNNRHGTAANNRSLVRNAFGSPGHYMSHLRNCTWCKQKRSQSGGRTQRGSNFVCAICLEKHGGRYPK